MRIRFNSPSALSTAIQSVRIIDRQYTDPGPACKCSLVAAANPGGIQPMAMKPRPRILVLLAKLIVPFTPMLRYNEETSFFLSRETIIPKPGRGMFRWRKWLFATMSRNA